MRWHWGRAQPGRLRSPHPSLAVLPLREQGATGLGTSQDVTRDGMCCDAAETSNCLEAGLGPGGGEGNICVMEVSPGHVNLLGPEGMRVQPGHCPGCGSSQAPQGTIARRCLGRWHRPQLPGSLPIRGTSAGTRN